MIKTLDKSRVAKFQQRRFNYVRGFDTFIHYDDLGRENEKIVFNIKESGGRGLPAFFTFSSLKDMVELAKKLSNGSDFTILPSDDPLLGLIKIVVYYNTEISGVVEDLGGEQIIKEKAEHLLGEWAIPIEGFESDEEMEEFQKWSTSFGCRKGEIK